MKELRVYWITQDDVRAVTRESCAPASGADGRPPEVIAGADRCVPRWITPENSGYPNLTHYQKMRGFSMRSYGGLKIAMRIG
jgi:hypothetical protein